MARRTKAKPKNVHVSLVLQEDVLKDVDALAKRLTAMEPGSIVTRSVVVRRAVYAFLDHAKQKEVRLP